MLRVRTRFTVLVCLGAAGFALLGARCNRGAAPVLTVTSPADGLFTTAPSVTVSGVAGNVAPANAVVTVNGIPVTVQPDRTFSTSVTLAAVALFNPILVELQVASTGQTLRERRTVINGPSVADGDYSPGSLGLRVNDTGLDQLEPVVNAQVAGSLNIPALVMAQNPIFSGCVVSLPLVGCVQSVTVDVTSLTHGAVNLALDSQPGTTNALVTIDNLVANYDSDGINCQGQITANTTFISTNQDQIPLAAQPSQIDVNQQNVSVWFSGFNHQFTGGICDLLSGIVGSLIGNLEGKIVTALQQNLGDPDGAGPADSPIAAAIQTALADTNIHGPVGDALGVTLDADFAFIAEDGAGISYDLDSRVTALSPDPQSPDLLESYEVLDPLPAYSATTPGGLPYGLGLSVSTAMLNQAIKAGIESGFLTFDVTELDLGAGPVPLTTDVLAFFVPEFGAFAAGTPARIAVRSSIAPVVCGLPGPGGELAEVRLSGLSGEIFVGLPGSETALLKFVMDTSLGLDLVVDAVLGELVPQIGALPASGIAVTVLSNAIGTSEANVQLVVQQVLSLVLPELGSSIGSIPLPQLQGLDLVPVEIAREGRVLTVYTDLVPVP